MRKSNYLFLTANNKNIKIFLIRHFCYFLSRMRAKDAWQAICVPVHHTISSISKPARQNPPQALPHPAETA